MLHRKMAGSEGGDYRAEESSGAVSAVSGVGRREAMNNNNTVND